MCAHVPVCFSLDASLPPVGGLHVYLHSFCVTVTQTTPEQRDERAWACACAGSGVMLVGWVSW